MSPEPSDDAHLTGVPDPREPAFARRIMRAWASGELIPARGDAPTPAPAAVSLAGVGESCAVWELSTPGAAPLVVRVPWHGEAEDASAALRREATALRLIPSGTGPRVIALHAGTEVLGRPALVLTRQPGTQLSPSAWTRTHLQAHARALAAFHQVEMPGRGELPPRDPQPLASLPSTVAAEFATTAGENPELLRTHDLQPLIDAALRRLGQTDWGSARRLVLAHGDLCATNVLWEAGTPRFIDVEWAMADDPARDLAIIAGPVHGGPWYVPATGGDVEAMVRAYVDTLAEHGIPEDTGALLERIPAWWAYERTAMLLHTLRRAADGSVMHREAARSIHRGLARLLLE